MRELAHLEIRNHGKQFIQLLDQNMRDWGQRKAQLNETILEFNNWQKSLINPIIMV
jgi:predicted metal-dependent hydrolase